MKVFKLVSKNIKAFSTLSNIWRRAESENRDTTRGEDMDNPISVFMSTVYRDLKI